MYMNCQVRARLVLRRNCFGVVGPTRARSEAAPGERSGSGARVHPLPSSRARPASRESAGGADRCFSRRKAGGVVALLDELPSLDEGGRTAYDPALMILLSACTLHARYGLSGTDKRCSTSELGDAIVQRRARE
jgi:hypothetical protein